MIICQYWIVVANASRVAIYCIYPKKLNQKSSLMHEFIHLQSRMKKKDLISDAPGYSRAPKSERGIHEEHVDVKELEVEHFAKEIAHFLDESLKHAKFKYLLLAISPHFYGILNKHLNTSVKNILKKIIKKDYFQLSTEGLEKIFFKGRSPRKADQRSSKQH